jgi:hypothetical protein
VHDLAVSRVRPAANSRGFVLPASSRPSQPQWTCVLRLAESVVCAHALHVDAQGRATRRVAIAEDDEARSASEFGKHVWDVSHRVKPAYRRLLGVDV